MPKWKVVVNLQGNFLGTDGTISNQHFKSVTVERDEERLSEASEAASEEAQHLLNSEPSEKGFWMVVGTEMTPILNTAPASALKATTYDKGDVHVSWIYDKNGNIAEPFIIVNREDITVTLDTCDYDRTETYGVPHGKKIHQVRRITHDEDEIIIDELLDTKAEV